MKISDAKISQPRDLLIIKRDILKVMNTFLKYSVIFFLFVIFTQPLETQAQTVKFGIIGDSNSDEYRADDNRGGSFSSVTFNWAELLQRYRGFNIGAWGCRSEPRRCGYEYNWARSGQNTASYVSSGQHTGLATQVGNGSVEYVFLQASENDFHTWNGTYEPIYNGTLSGTALQQKINGILGNLRTIVETLQSSGSVKIVVSTFNDKSIDPQIVASFPDASKRQRVTNAVNTLNQGIKSLAQEKNLGVFDTDVFIQNEYLPRLNMQTGTLRVGNQNIIITQRSNDPRYLQLGDSVGHAGTVGSGLYANAIVSAFNQKFNTNWQLFSDHEILVHAGLAQPSTSPSPTSSSTPTPTPQESAVCKADINLDGVVDLSDYSVLVAHFLQTAPTVKRTDISGDNVVDLSDYSLLVIQFLKTCQR